MSSYKDLVLATSGLVSYWRLNESAGPTATDEKGVNHGTYYDDNGNVPGDPYAYAQVGALSGSANRSVEFNTNLTGNRLIRVPDSASLDITGNMSLEFWFKAVDVGSSVCCFMGKGNINLSPPEQSYTVFWTSGRVVNWRFASSSTFYGCNSPAQSLNAWHHVVCTYDGTNAKLYVDGSLADTGAASGVTIQATNYFFGIGGCYNTGSTRNYFPGYLDEVAIYNAALDSTTVSDHYAAENDPESLARSKIFVPSVFVPSAFRPF